MYAWIKYPLLNSTGMKCRFQLISSLFLSCRLVCELVALLTFWFEKKTIFMNDFCYLKFVFRRELSKRISILLWLNLNFFRDWVEFLHLFRTFLITTWRRWWEMVWIFAKKIQKLLEYVEIYLVLHMLILKINVNWLRNQWNHQKNCSWWMISCR